MSILTVPTTEKIYSVTKENRFLSSFYASLMGKDISIEERMTLLLIRDLVRLGWRLKTNSSKTFELVPPEKYDKNVIKEAMAYSRNDVIDENAEWIKKHLPIGRSNLAKGDDVLKSIIRPRIEVCTTTKQNNIFRLFRYYWSSPASEYVGRRIRLIIRDDGIKGSPVIGIAALGSSIIHIPDRDKWIGWDTKTRSKRIVYMMDAYVIGALPPYNYLLGGKLISYILASNEVRNIFREKYADAETIIDKRKASDLVLIVTTSLYGQKSSQYNRLRYGKKVLYQPIGATSGYGSLHISNETFTAMRELADQQGCNTSNVFGMGPNWRMRVIRAACDALDLNSDVILKHSFQRGLFAVPLATNFRSFLNDEAETPVYKNMPMKRLVSHWRKRWCSMRKKNDFIIQKVKKFHPEQFIIEKTPTD